MTVVLIHAAVTWFMAGLIWTIQTVHYPLFAMVGDDSFVDYERQHTVRMGWLLAAPATTEVLTAASLVWLRPEELPLWLVLFSGAILAGIWVMSGGIFVRLHRLLIDDPSPALKARLVRANWWRTGAWSARAVLAAVMVIHVT